MTYEWTDFDEAVMLVDPWHGLYRASDGKIEAPNGIRTAVKGLAPICAAQIMTAPGGAAMALPACDSVLVRRPGQPAVTTPASEEALGKTWLNYNIMAGGEKVMAGRFCHYWLYQAPDGSRWYVTGSVYATLHNLAGVATLSLNLNRFGEFGQAAEQQIIANQTINFTAQTDLDGAGDGTLNISVMIDDVTETGHKAVVSVCYGVAGDVNYRRVLAVIEITLSGQPPTAVMAATLIAQESGLAWYDPWYAVGAPYPPAPTLKTAAWAFSGGVWNFLVWDGNFPTPASPRIVLVTSGTADYYREYLVGGRYDAAGTLQLIKGRVERHASATADVSAGTPGGPSPAGFVLTGSETVTGFARLMANGVTIDEISWNYSASGTQTDGADAITNSATVGGFTTSGTNATGAFTTGFGAINYIGTYMPVNIYEDILFQRYSNSLYGIVLREPYDMAAPGGTRGRWFGGVHGKLGQDTAIEKRAPDTDYPIYASEQPVTGQIARSASAVVWV
jgi:hypothetical protein